MRYFFDFRSGDQLAVDEEGLEIPSLERAKAEAACSLVEMARDIICHDLTQSVENMGIEVRTETGTVMTVRFSFLMAEVDGASGSSRKPAVSFL